MARTGIPPQPSQSSGKAQLATIVIGLVVGLCAILVAVEFFRREGAEQADAAPAGKGPSRVAAQAAERRDVDAGRAKYRRELLFCEALGKIEGADLACLGDFAAEYKDPFFCGEVPSASRSECFEKVARSTGRASLCDNVSGLPMKTECYFDAAALSGEEGPCERVRSFFAAEDADWQVKACRAIAKKDASACESLTGKPGRSACFRRLAIATRDPEYCEKLRNDMGEGFEHELYACQVDVAVAAARIGDCDRIPHKSIYINTSGMQHWRECRQKVSVLIESGITCRDRDLTCRGRVAAAKNDVKSCRSLSSYTDIDICTMTFALRRNDGSVCGSLQEERFKTACVEFTAAQ